MSKMTLAEIKEATAQHVMPLVNAFLAEESKKIQDEVYKELDKKRSDFMAELVKHDRVPAKKERDQMALGAGRLVRAVAVGRIKGTGIDGAAQWMREEMKMSDVEVKGLLTSVTPSGGVLVPPDQAAELIELLRPISRVRAAGAIVLPMPNGQLQIPKLTASAGAEYVGEATAQNAVQPTTGMIKLVFKKLQALVPVSRELVAMSTPAADGVVRDDLVLALGTREDKAFIRDDGTADKPKGIRYWAASGSVKASAGADDGSAPTLAEIDTDLLGMMQDLEGANVRMIRPGWLMSPRSKNYIAGRRLAATSDGPAAYPTIQQNPPMLYGMQVYVSNNVPSNLAGQGSQTVSEIYLVDFADCVIGDNSQIELEASTEAAYVDSSGTLVSAFSRGEMVVKAVAHHDFAMRHAESASIRTSVVYGAL